MSTEDPNTLDGMPAPAREPAEKPAPARPAEDVTLDLDTMEREGAKGPFSFLHAGRKWFLSDPQDMDWQHLLLAMGDYRFFLRQSLPADDRDEFFDTHLSAWKLRVLMDRYMQHYGLPKPPEADALPA